jgi:MFS family permease
MRIAPGLAPLRHRDFALYWAGLTVSNVGDWMETTTTAWLLYEITGSPLLLGLWGGTRAAAIVVFGLIGGTLADRVPRRRLLLATQSGFALTSLALFAFVASDTVTPAHIYVASAVTATLGAFDAPARRSLYPTLVPRSQLQNATTLNGSVFRLARLIGPALAGIIIATLGPATSYLVNAVSSAAILAAIVLIRTWTRTERERASFLSETLDGLRYTFRTPPLGHVLLLEVGHSLFGANTALVTIVAKDLLDVGPSGLGFLVASLGAGALFATVTLVAVGDVDRKGRFMLIMGGGYALLYAAFGLSRSFELSTLLLFAIGATDAYWTTMRTTIFQLRSDDAYRGRTLSALLLAGRGSTQGSQLVTGVAVSALGPVLAVMFGAAVVGGSLLGVNVWDPRVRRFRGDALPAANAASEIAAP